MRALALLLIVVAAFLAVRWLAPDPDPVRAAVEPELETTKEEPRFLPPPTRPAASEAGQESGSTLANPGESAQIPVRPEPAHFQDSPQVEAGELAAARALAHGTPDDVELASAGLPRERALLFEAFALAAAGEKQVAHALAGKLDRDQVDERERALLESVLEGRSALPAGVGGGSPAVYAMEMRLLAREAELELEAKEYPAAARAFSDLLQADLEAPFGADPAALTRWTDGLDRAQREHRWNPRGNWAGEELQVQGGDSLISIRKRYLSSRPEARMCTGLIERANRLSGVLQPGQKLRVPIDPARVLVDLEARWALYFLGDEVAAAWPVCIGRPGEETPPGDYTAIEKTENPPWMKVGQEPIPFGDPRNPLGTRWIGWARGGSKTPYGFHGTREPESIGRAASDGCVRFLNEDVEELFKILPEGTQIHVRG